MSENTNQVAQLHIDIPKPIFKRLKYVALEFDHTLKDTILFIFEDFFRLYDKQQQEHSNEEK